MKTVGWWKGWRGLALGLLLALGLFVVGCATGGPEPAELERRIGPSSGDLPPTVQVVSYHDVRPELEGDLDPDRYGVSTARLVEHFEWFREEGYTPVSLEQIMEARQGRTTLPDRPILLSFDDGLRSVYTEVFPLLELYRYPAVVAVVTAWQDAPDGWTLEYDGLGVLGPEDFVSWDELREMQASGLVEVASHSHDLHKGILGNPFGNEQPAAVTRVLDPETDRYESEAEWRARVRADLELSSRRIEEELGRAPRAIVWPYGAHNRVLEEMAVELGMVASITLRPGDQPVDELHGMRRYLISGNPDVDQLAWLLRKSARDLEEAPVRVVHVDLDYVFDPDPVQMERNLDALLDRIEALGPNTVYLQAFADPEGDGTARALYFPNRHLPVRSDLFNRVAWQLMTRVDVEVLAWMPMLAFDLGDDALNDALSVKRWEGEDAVPSRPDYWRLSPWEAEAREIVSEIFEDLAAHAAFDGILFHDDAYLNDREDASAFPGEPGRLPTTEARTSALLDFGDELLDVVRQYRPVTRSARNLYARVVLEPHSEEWFAQNFRRSLERYDQVAVMAMPYMEEARNPDRWLSELFRRVEEVPGGLEGTVFELQSVDWRGPEPIPARELAEWMRSLEALGAPHFGYYPDDFIQGHPDADVVRRVLSVERDPWARR